MAVDGGVLSPSVITAQKLAPRSFGSDATIPKYSSSAIAMSKFGSKLSAFLSNPLVGLILASGTSLYAQHMQNEYTRSANKEARVQALLDRAHEEFYNSPAMQKLRLKEAGLSPADYIGGFETSTRESPVNIPDFSYLAQAGQAGISGMLNMQTYRDENRRINASIKLLEAQAEEAAASAATARHRQQLDIASKEYQNSLLSKQVASFDKQIQSLDLDNESKSIANYIANKTKELAVQIKGQEFRGLSLSNDFKDIEIEGKRFEVDKLLPQELRALIDKHNLSEKEAERLGYMLDILGLESFKANSQLQVYKEEYDRYIQSIVKETRASWNNAEIAFKYSLFKSLVSNTRGDVGSALAFLAKLGIKVL